ncbi:MAG: glycosyltransferase family 2 protein [Planctomycetota bacterium]
MNEETSLRLLLAALGVLAYTYAGYPLLILLLERLFYRPVRKAPMTPPLSLIVPVYNEAEAIGPKIENLLALDYPREKLCIVVANDGSTDGTGAIVRALARPGIVLHDYPTRRGKAVVLNDEVPQCETDLVVLADARQRIAPDALRELVANFADPEVGGASGELMLDPPRGEGVGRGISLYWRYEKLIRKAESGIHSTVGATGALFAFRKALWRGLPPRTIVDDMVVPFQIVEQGRRVVLEEKARIHDRASEHWEREFVRKTRTLAGNFQILRYPFAMAAPLFNRITFQFLSHKVLRLLGPPALMTLFWTSHNMLRLAELKGEESGRLLYGSLLAAQGLFYFAGLLGLVAERLSLRIPLAGLVYAFLLTQVAIVCGFLRFGSGRDEALWEKTLAADTGGLYPRVARLFFDSALFCIGILLAFYLRYGGHPPAYILHLYQNLIPRVELAGYTFPVPLLMLVPLTILYFFRIHERRTADTDPEFVLTVIHGVLVSTLAVMLFLYKMRGSWTIAHEGRVASFPTLVLVLSFFVNAALIAGWRLAWKALRHSALSAEGACREVLLVSHDPPPSAWFEAIEQDSSTPTRIAGYLGPRSRRDTRPFLGRPADLTGVLERMPVDGVLLAAGGFERRDALATLAVADHRAIETGLLPGDLELLLGRARLQLKSYIPVLPTEASEPSEISLLGKRLVDLAGGACLLLSGLPAGLIPLLLQGRRAMAPTFRIGRMGRAWRLWRPAPLANGSGRFVRRSLRRLLLGWHLLKGDLALIGPPSLSQRQYARGNALERSFLTMRPGIYGPRRLWVSGRPRIGRAYLHTLFYQRNFRMSLDLHFLAKEFRGFLFRTRRAVHLSR